MIIERPPEWFRRLAPEAWFRLPDAGERRVYLTFDDGPIPEVTPQLLDILDEYGIKATFFMVGDNVRKYPALYEEVIKRGHAVGNHTMHHLVGMKERTRFYMDDIREAAGYIDSKLFRPPHGWLRWNQRLALRRQGYKLVMYDLVTRDYSKRLTEDEVFENVGCYARPGSIIVFHDSLKSLPRFGALRRSIEWLTAEGYSFGKLNQDIKR